MDARTINEKDSQEFEREQGRVDGGFGWRKRKQRKSLRIKTNLKIRALGDKKARKTMVELACPLLHENWNFGFRSEEGLRYLPTAVARKATVTPTAE